jgi:gluconate kinase
MAMEPEVRAVALTGTIATGKTTLAEAMSEELHELKISHALLDLDWLGQVYPNPEGQDPFGYDLALRNLKEIWPNFRAVGEDKAIIAGTLLNRDQRERLDDALGRIAISVALVKAPQEVIEARIRSRNTDRLQEDFLARTAEVARDIESAAFHDFDIPNDGRSARQLALEALRRLNWISST